MSLVFVGGGCAFLSVVVLSSPIYILPLWAEFSYLQRASHPSTIIFRKHEINDFPPRSTEEKDEPPHTPLCQFPLLCGVGFGKKKKKFPPPNDMRKTDDRSAIPIQTQPLPRQPYAHSRSLRELTLSGPLHSCIVLFSIHILNTG